jgi:hypothetical protein
MASFVDDIITAEDTFTASINTGSESRVHITCAGDGAEGFGSTIVTVQTKPHSWPATQWVTIGAIITADSAGQSQFIEAGSNIQVRAKVLEGDFDEAVAIFLAV